MMMKVPLEIFNISELQQFMIVLTVMNSISYPCSIALKIYANNTPDYSSGVPLKSSLRSNHNHPVIYSESSFLSRFFNFPGDAILLHNMP